MAVTAETSGSGTQKRSVNIARRLREFALRQPDVPATIEVAQRHRDGTYTYNTWTFRELDDESDRMAAGLREMGVAPGCGWCCSSPSAGDSWR